MAWTAQLKNQDSILSKCKALLSPKVQTGMAAYPAFYQKDTGRYFAAGKMVWAIRRPIIPYCRDCECMEMILYSPIRLQNLMLDFKNRSNFTFV
jgi:hypothetical protein